MGERLAMPGCRAEYAVSWGKEFLSTPSAGRATGTVDRQGGIVYYFYPRPPRGGRLAGYIGNGICRAFLSTPSVRRATVSAVVVVAAGHISIHTLREEGDLSSRLLVLVLLHFYPRPPRGGRQPHRGILSHHRYFYPRPPRGGRPEGNPPGGQLEDISIHALREEGDTAGSEGSYIYWAFLSTPSARRATSRFSPCR